MEAIKKYLRHVWAGMVRFFGEKPLDPLMIRHSLKEMTPSSLRADAQAGFNVFLLTIPQGMAYAAIADMPIVAGILSSIAAALVAPLFSSSRFTSIGPTNATSLMLFSFFAVSGIPPEQKVIIVPLLILMVGIICVIGAFFKFAELLQFVSRSVLVGYITGAATLIMANQFKHVLGIADQLEPTTSFIGLLLETGRNLIHTSWQPVAIGITCIALYFTLKNKLPKLPAFGLTLILISMLSFAIKSFFPALGFAEIAWFGDIELSALAPTIPWQVNDIWDTAVPLLPIACALAFLASLENTVMSKSLATQSGTQTDVNQDMLSLGISNITSSFFGSMPVSGSLTRSALNFSSGAKSGISSWICGIFCLIGVFVLAKFGLVSKIPKACLAALVISVAISLINWKNIRVCLQSTSDDAIVIISTCFATLLLPLHIAIFLGVILSIILFLRKASRPVMQEYEFTEEGELRARDLNKQRTNPRISIVQVEGSLYFGAAELFRAQIQSVAQDPNIRAVVLRMKNARHLDATSVLALTELIKFARKSDCHVLISGMTKDVYKLLKRSGVVETIQAGCNKMEGETNIFMHLPSNPNISTRDALIRAQSLLGTQEADIKLFMQDKK